MAKLVDVLTFVGWPEDTDMVAKRIAQTKFVTCASPAYWQARGVPRDPEELRAHDCLAFRTPWDVVLDLWKYQRGEDVRSIAVEPRIVADDRDWIIGAAVRGLGVVRIADLPARQIFEQGLLEPRAHRLGSAGGPTDLCHVSPAAPSSSTRIRGFPDRALREAGIVSSRAGCAGADASVLPQQVDRPAFAPRADSERLP